ncbi:MAG: type II toxin-antitoxin system Phd/YefM family antitoxin, partial [Tetragenococcus halophilus]|nr:type II toxin-antitoxin system Phd/YefM family antitoxin [Tetragenococcus halophilus]
MDKLTETYFRKNLFEVIDKINKENTSLEITTNSVKSAVILPKRKYERMQEELYLWETGTLSYAIDLMNTSVENDFEEL